MNSLLSKLLRFFQTLSALIARGFKILGTSIAWLLRNLFGIQLTTPTWLPWLSGATQRTSTWTKANPRIAYGGMAAFLIVAVGAYGGWRWYQALPKPVEVLYSTKAPERTKIEVKDARPDPLIVSFQGSVAPLANAGKEVTTDIEISPAIQGRWIWENDKELRFHPQTDWPVGQEFSVTMAKKGFVTDQVRLPEYSFKFQSAPFVAAFQSSEFYQDPVDPNLKKAVFTINFSHPVDPTTLEKEITLKLQGPDLPTDGVDTKFTVNYDKLKLNAYIHSAPLPIPKENSIIRATMAAGPRAKQGGPAIATALNQAVAVPGLFGLQVQSAAPTLANNERFEPEQVLVLETSATVHEKDFANNVAAYALPIYHPATKPEERKRPYSWGDVTVIGPEILQQSEALKLEAIPSEREFTQIHSFKYQADVGRYVYLRINKDIKSFGGYLMRKPYDAIVRVPEYPKEVRILANGSLLAMSGEKKLSVFSRDTPALHYELGRLLPNQIQHFVTQSSGQYAKPDFSEHLDATNLVERFEESVALPKMAPGKPQYHAFDVSKYLDKSGDNKRGVFMLKVEGVELRKDGRIKTRFGSPDTRLVVVTDLGMLVKKSVDGAQDIFVQSIANGDPVFGATVEVLGKNGLPVLTQTTDNEGHARFPNLKNFKRERQPALYLVRKGGDVSFLPINRSDRELDISRFDIGGVANTAQTDKLTAYLFSDRGIYRPGDEIRVGMIVKAGDWATKLAGIPLEAIVTDARGLTIKREKLKLSASAFEELRFTTLDTSPTGDYNINLHIVKDNEPASLLGSLSVKVQEFQPDRMRMTAWLSSAATEGWVSPEDLKARVSLQNLFGTPAANRRVTGTMTLAPAYPAFPRYSQHIFYDPQRSKEGFNERLAETKTDDKGEAEFDLNLQRFTRATYRLLVVAQGFEAEGGRSVTAEAGGLVSSMPHLVGYKPDGDLGYVSKGSARSVEFIAINPQAKKIDLAGLTISHIERKYVSVLTKQDSGIYKYESVKKEVKLSETPFKISAASTTYPLPSAEPGAYALVVRDASGLDLSRVEYNVAGAANVTRSLEKNAELQLALDKADYQPGEEIEVQIKAPYVGAGLITLEREKVHAYRWFKSTTTSSVQKIKIPAGFEGNGYVSVSFVRDAGSEEIFMSPLSYGVTPFQVNLDQRKAKLDVTAPTLVKPGDALKLKVKSDMPTRVVVFAIDEGILQVAGYKTPNPLGYFFQKRSLDVKTAQILDLILPEFKRLATTAAPGGDAGALGRNLNPFKRKRDKPVAYWSGLIDMPAGERELNYVVPDYFNGSLRVMAVSVSDAAIGVVEKKTTVRGDFVLSPNVPTTVAPGDEFSVSVGVANNVAGSGADAAINVGLTPSPHFEVVGSAKTNLTIGELREGSTTFRLRAKEKLGSGTLTFTSALNGKSGKIAVDISVRPVVPYMSTLAAGEIGTGKSVDTPITRNMYPEYRTLEAGASNLPLTLAHGLTAYLNNFPYSCTEQLVSQGVPAMVLAQRPEFGYVKAKSGDSLADLIAVLRSRQNGEGGFGLWAANFHVNEYVSVYATHFLLEARDRGHAIPADMLRLAESYLDQLAASEPNGEDRSMAGERVRAYAIYLLTRQGRVTTNYAASLQQRLEAQYAKTWRQDLTTAYLAAIYRLMKQDRLADKLISDVKFDGGGRTGFESYYDGLIHNSGLLYVTARHFPERVKKLPQEALPSLVKPIQEGHYNTLS
ncbi:MAG TPA: alpha-2-macroglobulin, partial [Burkholderiales bacterium]|nr:alpha-2-macroglobulin [Burkholderiales bacterium]